jgi:hypothetical protein
MEFEPMHLGLNNMSILRTLWQNILFGDQTKPLEILILMYPNQAENFVLWFLYSGY